MDYRTALGQIAAGVPLADIAQEAGVSEAEIRRTRLEPTSGFYLPPPANWRQVLAQLAWERAVVLQAFARQLEAEAERAVL